MTATRSTIPTPWSTAKKKAKQHSYYQLFLLRIMTTATAGKGFASSLPRLVAIALAVVALTLVYAYLAPPPETTRTVHQHQVSHIRTQQGGLVPAELFDLGIYKEHDFVNPGGIRPTFWTRENQTASSLLSSWGPCYPSQESVDWPFEMEQYRNAVNNDNGIHISPSLYIEYQPAKHAGDNVAGFCRPGFLIIGAGKCGTRYVALVGSSQLFLRYKMKNEHSEKLCWIFAFSRVWLLHICC